MMRKEFQLHEVIFQENDFQKWMYSICEGSVDIFAGYGTPEERKLATLTAGQFFGEIGMIAMMPRTATAVAAEENVVLEQISEENFGDYLKKHPQNLQPIMSGVSRRIRELTEDLSEITRMTNEVLREKEKGNSASGWLAGAICNLLRKLNAKLADCNEFSIQRKRQQALSGEIPPVVRLNAGDVIFRAGEQADCMYSVFDGTVGIYSDYRTENEKLLASLHADDVFGEMGILDDMPRSATAVCLTNCAVVVVKPENFMGFFQDKPVKILQILQQMCFRLRRLTGTYLQVCQELAEMTALEENDFPEGEVLAKLEHIRQTHLSVCLYDNTGFTDWVYDYL